MAIGLKSLKKKEATSLLDLILERGSRSKLRVSRPWEGLSDAKFKDPRVVCKDFREDLPRTIKKKAKRIFEKI